MTDDEILQLLYDETLVGNAPAVTGGVREGLEHEQGCPRALGHVSAAADDVVRSQRLGHGPWQGTDGAPSLNRG